MVTALALSLALTLEAAPAKASSLRDMVEIATLSSPSVSPDGRWVLYRQEQASLADDTRRLSWWAAPTTGKAPPIKLVDGGEAIWSDAGPAAPEVPQWSADGWVYVRALTDEGVQIWRANPATRETVAVTNQDADIESFVVDASGVTWRAGPSRADILRAEQAEYEAGVRIDASVDPAQNLFAAVKINGRFASQRLAGRWFARRGLLGDTPARYFHAGLDGADVRTIDAAAAERLGLAADSVPALFSGPPKLAAASPFGRLVVNRSRNAADVHVQGLADQPPIRCADPACKGPITSAIWWPGRAVAILTRTEQGHRQSLMTWDIGRNSVRVIAGGFGLIGGGQEASPCAVGAFRAFCIVAAPDTPPRLEAIDLKTGRRRVVAAPNEALALGRGHKAEHLAWRDPSGNAFTGVFIPARATSGGRPPPLFLTYYNCDGFVLGGVGDEWPLRAFADEGIASLCINKTGAPAEKQDSVANYKLALSGILAIVDQLKAAGWIDGRRIGMGGLSFGSEVTMWVATESPLLRALSIASPQLEPVYYWIHGVTGRDNHGPLRTAWGLGGPDETPERWKVVSPALKADRIKAAVLMQMAEQEYRNAPELLARLSNSRTPVEAFVFAQEPHIKVQPRHKLAVYERNLDWFRFWLMDAEDPAADKADQYARWRRLRDRTALEQP